MDYRDVEALAWQSYRRHLGKILEIREIDGWRQLHSFTVIPDRPLLVEVVETASDDIINWHNDWLDPIWSVKPIEEYPELFGMDGFWIFGQSFSVSGEKGDPTWKVVELPTETKKDTTLQSEPVSGVISTLRSALSRATQALALKVRRSR